MPNGQDEDMKEVHTGRSHKSLKIEGIFAGKPGEQNRVSG